jgi:hypothetical protein
MDALAGVRKPAEALGHAPDRELSGSGCEPGIDVLLTFCRLRLVRALAQRTIWSSVSLNPSQYAA